MVTLLLGRAGVTVDIAGGHLAEDGEEDGEAEVAAETPPHTTLKQRKVGVRSNLSASHQNTVGKTGKESKICKICCCAKQQTEVKKQTSGITVYKLNPLHLL